MKRMTMRSDMTIIDKKCIEKGISRAELSRRSGVPIRTLESWSARQRKSPGVAQLYRVAQVLECHMEELIEPEMLEVEQTASK